MGLINVYHYHTGFAKTQFQELRRMLMSVQEQVADLTAKAERMDSEIAEVSSALQDLRDELATAAQDNPGLSALSEKFQAQINKLDALTPNSEAPVEPADSENNN
jgi:chromosome segregation ATPase